MAIKNAERTVYHIKDGPARMYLVDANSAVGRFPQEWSNTPWTSKGEKTAPVIEISPDWQDLKPSERITLACRFGAKRPGLTSAKADELIQAEVDRRARSAENTEGPVVQ